MTDLADNQEQKIPEQKIQWPEEDEISISDLFMTFWRYRRAIVIWSLAAILIIAVLGGSKYLRQPRTAIAELKFKLEFDGIEKNEYPNGMKFSTADILASPVIKAVYRNNDLEKYIELPDFKAALAITQTNDKLKFLEFEYNAKLSNTKLSVEERDKLEAAFLEKKQNAMVPIYILSLSLQENLPTIPAKVTRKALRDILKIWADYADRVKGALKYRMAVVSRNIIDKESLEQEEYLVVMDIFRDAIKRIQKDIDSMQKIPGSNMLKIGENKVSLSDLEYRMGFINKFKLSPLSGIIRQTGVSRNKETSINYLENKLFVLELTNNEIKARKEIYEQSLKNYLAKGAEGADTGALGGYAGESPLEQQDPRAFQSLIPQFGSSFLNSLMELGKEQSDADFRQEITRKAIKAGIENVSIQYDIKYYQKQMEMIAKSRTDNRQNDDYYETGLVKVKTTINDVYEDLMQSIEQVNAIYLDLSRHNLDPRSQLYAVLQPVTQNVDKTLKPSKLLMFMILAVLLAEGMIFFSVLIANMVSRQKKS